MKDIVIIANFCGDFSESDNGRFIYLCKELSKDNTVEIITSDFSHFTKCYKNKLVNDWPFKITYLHESGYDKNISLKRLISHRTWGNSVLKYLRERENPDVVYCATPSLSAPLKASKYCIENKIKFIVDIQDLWPEAFKMVFNVPIMSNIIFSPLKKMADTIYQRANVICGVSESYVNRALEVSDLDKEHHAVFLGTNLEDFDSFTKNNPIIKKNKDEKWLGYCGSLSSSYDIKCIIDALSILKNRKKEIPKFIIMGDGEKKSEFENYANLKGIDTVFTGRLPYDQMCPILSQCDIVVNPITGKSAASIINKHGDYASAGVPVINTQDSVEYKKLVEKYNMGFNCENSNSKEVAEKIEILLANNRLREDMGLNARKCAKEKFDRDYTYKELIDTILA